MGAFGRIFNIYVLATLLLLIGCSEANLFGSRNVFSGLSPQAGETSSQKPAGKDQPKSEGTTQAPLILAKKTAEDTAYGECKSIGGAAGHCRHLRYCMIDEFLDTPKAVDEFACTIEKRYIGVCCPDDKKSGPPTPAPAEKAEEVEKVNGKIVYGLPKLAEAPVVIPQKSPLGPPGKNRGCGVNALENSVPTSSSGKTESGEYPWMVAIISTSNEDQFCGGVLLDQLHVLSAAHCFNRKKPEDIAVSLGEYDVTDASETRSQVINVSRITNHADYVAANYENDIAILRLSRPAIFNGYVWPICLPEPEDMENIINRTAVVAGWGLTSGNSGDSASTTLLVVSVPIWENEICQKPYTEKVYNTMICAAAYEGGKDSCKGDSGGPLMIQKKDGRWTNIGVVSFGISCAEPMQPGVYTRVVSYLPWIEKHTQD